MNKLLLVAVVVVVSSSCGLPGAPALDSQCDPMADAAECYSDTQIAICDRVTLRWYAERCTGRCSNAQEPRCEVPRPVLGKACRPGEEGAGFCSGDNERAKCTGGVWRVERECPQGCYERDFGVTCN
jgi:hypothetical protein